MSGDGRLLRAGAAVGLAIAMLAACGLSANDHPEPLPHDELPPELQDTATDGSTPALPLPETAPNTAPQPIWFLRTDETGSRYLEAVPRPVPLPGRADQLIEALIQQAPNEFERADRFNTFVPGDARLLDRPEPPESGVLEVNFSESFYDLQGGASRYAFAQVVYTLTELGGVEEVRFLNEGRAFEVVDGEGESRSGPVDRDDYRNLEPGE